VPCPQHGSGVNIVDLIKDNIGTQPAPMLKALCNDPSLRTGCTCHHPGSEMIHTPQTLAATSPNYSAARRLSLSQPLSAWEQPGTVARPYSWASENGGQQLLNLQLADGTTAVIGGRVAHSSLDLVHRHSDSGTTAYRMHAAPIMANH